MILHELIETADKSVTCRDPVTGELYHNSAGAYLEALMNYAEPANLKSRIAQKSTFNFLDVCFGMGYNTWATLQKIIEGESDLEKINITAIELDEHILETIPAVLDQSCFATLNQVLSDQASQLNRAGDYRFQNDKTMIHLKILVGDLKELLSNMVATDAQQFDLVFHDPFSAKRVPELWTIEIFELYKRLLKVSGAALTYSSAGPVRGALAELGFHLYSTSTVGAKRGGTLASLSAVTTSASVFPLSQAETARVQGPGGVPFRGKNLSSREEIVQARRTEQRLRFSEFAATRLNDPSF